jgi:hypothetical protein
MKYNFSSAIPINYKALGLPIPEDSSLVKSETIAFTFKELPEPLFSPELNIRVTRLEPEKATLNPIWQWIPEWNLLIQGEEIVQFKEGNWDEVTEEVLHARAQTWMELAGL